MVTCALRNGVDFVEKKITRIQAWKPKILVTLFTQYFITLEITGTLVFYPIKTPNNKIRKV
jgi:hypothetical protein